MFTLVIGGSASGKSEFAERYALALPAAGASPEKKPGAGGGDTRCFEACASPEKRTGTNDEEIRRFEASASSGKRIYIAAMRPFGEEAQARIARHHEMRKDRGFETIERYTDLLGLTVPAGSSVLLEDLGNLIANEMFSDEKYSDEKYSDEKYSDEKYSDEKHSDEKCSDEKRSGKSSSGQKSATSAVLAGLDHLLLQCAHLTVVTNEVFSGGCGYEGETDLYLGELAFVNEAAAKKADRVIEVVCGIPVDISAKNLKTWKADCFTEEGRRMIFVTGPLFSGKQRWIMEMLGWSEEDFAQRAVRDVQDLAGARVCGTGNAGSCGEHRDFLIKDEEILRKLADELAHYEVVIATEVGSGVVPADPEERRRREAAGRLACMLADRADVVIRVLCGQPQFLKAGGMTVPRADTT